MLQYALYASYGGPLIGDYSHKASGVSFATNNRGYAECQAFLSLSLQEAMELRDYAGTPYVQVFEAGRVFEGRLEDRELVNGGITLRAFGYARALSDMVYIALWSMSDVTQFKPLTTEEVSSRAPESYAMDTNGRIQIALNKGATWATNTSIGSMVYQMPDKSTRQIVGISFDLTVALPLNWRFQIITWQSGYLSGTSAYIYTGTTAIESLNRWITVAGCDYVEFAVYNATGSPYTNTDETSRWKATITNIRLVSSTTNAVNTTTTAPITAGTLVSVPVVTTANMYVGQRLHLGIPASLGFAATVDSIPNSTHFVVANLTSSMASGGNVQAHVIYADEVVKDLVVDTAAFNPTQLSGVTSLIQSPGVDLFQEVYEDRYPTDILDYLVRLGDNQSTPRQWEWGVLNSQMLYFRPQGSAARTWYVDASELTIQSTVDSLYNSVYPVYQNAAGRTLRGFLIPDSASVARYGITRQKALAVQTTDAGQASNQAAAARADSADPPPRSGITIDKVYDGAGASWPLWLVRAGDTVIIRNLPPTLSVFIDRIRTFRLNRVEYDADKNTLALEPENALPTLEALLSAATPPSYVTTPWWLLVQQ